MKTYNWLCVSMATIFAAGSIGCGQSLRPYSAKGVDSALAVEADNAMAKAEEAAKLAQGAIDEANSVIKSVTDENGNINIGWFKKASASDVQAKGLLDPITNQLRAVFDKLFAKVFLVKEQFGVARQALNDALVKLNQADPAAQAQIAIIMAQLAKLDQLEAKFSTQMHSLASKLDLATAGLDAIIKGITTFIPGWGSIVGLALDFLVMGELKTLILELKTKLMAL